MPNPGFTRIPFNERTGLKFEVKRANGAAKWVKDLRKDSFFSIGPSIFNMLPQHLNNFAILDVPSKADVEKYKKENWMQEFLVNPTYWEHKIVEQQKPTHCYIKYITILNHHHHHLNHPLEMEIAKGNRKQEPVTTIIS